MKKLIVISFIGILCFSACKKKNTCDQANSSVVASAAEISDLQTYFSTNGIVATQDQSGLFYQIITAGGNDYPNLCSDVSVRYKGTLLSNGSVFDESASTVTFPLANLIVGWQNGIPKIGKGGKIKLFIPASLAYGNKAQSGIPANSHLIFDIELMSFIN